MKELALHVLDIAENSVRAGAALIEIEIQDDAKDGMLRIAVLDNGKGLDMDAKLCDPFHTTKGGKRFGFGIPFFRQSAEEAGGGFSMGPRKGGGTEVRAWFQSGHIDLKPMGDMGATVAALVAEVAGNPGMRLVVRIKRGESAFEFDTMQLSEELDGLPLGTPAVLKYVKDEVNEALRRTDGSEERKHSCR